MSTPFDELVRRKDLNARMIEVGFGSPELDVGHLLAERFEAVRSPAPQPPSDAEKKASTLPPEVKTLLMPDVGMDLTPPSYQSPVRDELIPQLSQFEAVRSPAPQPPRAGDEVKVLPPERRPEPIPPEQGAGGHLPQPPSPQPPAGNETDKRIEAGLRPPAPPVERFIPRFIPQPPYVDGRRTMPLPPEVRATPVPIQPPLDAVRSPTPQPPGVRLPPVPMPPIHPPEPPRFDDVKIPTPQPPARVEPVPQPPNPPQPNPPQPPRAGDEVKVLPPERRPEPIPPPVWDSVPQPPERRPQPQPPQPPGKTAPPKEEPPSAPAQPAERRRRALLQLSKLQIRPLQRLNVPRLRIRPAVSRRNRKVPA